MSKPQELAPTTPAPTAPAAPRRRTSKARKELQSLVGQIDSLIPSLSDKPAKIADLLIEKASLVKTLLAEEAEDHESEQTEKIEKLEAAQKVSATRISELERQNRELKIKASTPEIITVSDPKHAQTVEERDLLQSIVTALTAAMSEQSRIETAVRLSLSSSPATESFCRLVHVDYRVLNNLMHFTEPELKRLEVAPDYSNVALARGVLRVKFAPVKNEPAVFVPDTRSAEEKLREAKLWSRSL